MEQFTLPAMALSGDTGTASEKKCSGPLMAFCRRAGNRTDWVSQPLTLTQVDRELGKERDE
jgi:hypothetical protein